MNFQRHRSSSDEGRPPLAAARFASALDSTPAASRAAAARPAVRMSSGDEDPTANPLIQAVNSLQEAMQNSPVANLKQSLAKMQAGDYDVDAVSARLNGLISDTPAVMFSFST